MLSRGAGRLVLGLLAVGLWFATETGAGLAGRGGLSALAQPAGGRAAEIGLRARLGFDGHFKRGFWTPLVVTLDNAHTPVAAELVIEITRGSWLDAATTVYRYPLPLPAAAGHRLALPILLEDLFFPVRLSVQSGDRVLAAHEIPLVPAAVEGTFVVVLKRHPGGFGFLARPAGQSARHVAYVTDPRELPDSWIALDGVDVVIVHDLPLAFLTARQQDALHDWVRAGGHLLVVAAREGGNHTASWLAALLPVTVEGGLITTSVGGLAALGPAPPAERALAWQVRPGKGEVLAAEERLPLAAVARAGAGRVSFLNADPAAPPLAAWPGLPSALETLLAAGGPHAAESRQGRRAEETFPPAWLAGSARGEIWQAVRQLSFRLPGREALLALVTLYAVGLGVTCRVAARQPRGWLLPVALVVLFSAVGYGAIGRPATEYPFAAGEVTVLLRGAEGDLARQVTFIGLARGDGRPWTWQLPPSAPWMAPMGPGEGPRAGVLDVAGRRAGAPRPTASVRGAIAMVPLTAHGLAPFPVEVGMAFEGEATRLQVWNRTPYRLVRVVAVHRGQRVVLGDVPPGGRSFADLPDRSAQRDARGRQQLVSALLADARDAVPAPGPAAMAGLLRGILVPGGGPEADHPSFLVGFLDPPPGSGAERGVRRGTAGIFLVELSALVEGMAAGGGSPP